MPLLVSHAVSCCLGAEASPKQPVHPHGVPCLSAVARMPSHVCTPGSLALVPTNENPPPFYLACPACLPCSLRSGFPDLAPTACCGSILSDNSSSSASRLLPRTMLPPTWRGSQPSCFYAPESSSLPSLPSHLYLYVARGATIVFPLNPHLV